MKPTDEFSDYHTELLDGSYDCVDRIVVNAYFPLGQSGGGFRYWWRLLEGSDDSLDETHLMRMAGRFSRRVRAWAKAKGVRLIDCRSGVRKHEVAESYLPKDPDFVGVFLILVSRAQARVWEAERFKTGGVHLKPKEPWPYVNHYSFHIMDPEWGHLTIKMSGHPPFGAQIILNGHEWVERAARGRGLQLVKEGNCFTEASDTQALDEIADTLNAPHSIGRLSRVCERWIYSACLCFGLSLADQERTQFRYQYSAYQLEYSRNLIFHRGRELDQVFQGLIDRTRSTLDVRTLTTVFGRQRRPCWHWRSKGKAPLLQVTLERPVYNLTIFKLHFGKLTLKIYDKGERVLRIEAIAHNSRDLRCHRDLACLPEMVAALCDILIRFLNTLRYADVAFLDAGALDELPQPTTRGKNRVAGIDLNHARMRTVTQALIALGPKPQGFSVSDLAARVRELSGWSAEQYGTRHASYDLKKIRAKGLLDRVDGSRRYTLVAHGFQTLCALLILREKVLKPVLASVGKKPGRRPPKHISPVDVHYRSLQREMRATLCTLGIAA